MPQPRHDEHDRPLHIHINKHKHKLNIRFLKHSKKFCRTGFRIRVAVGTLVRLVNCFHF